MPKWPGATGLGIVHAGPGLEGTGMYLRLPQRLRQMRGAVGAVLNQAHLNTFDVSLK